MGKQAVRFVAGEPYTPQMIAALLRQKSDEELRTTNASAFHSWPIRQIVPCATIRELIVNEQAKRRRSQ